jgi:alpha-galactosidase
MRYVPVMNTKLQKAARLSPIQSLRPILAAMLLLAALLVSAAPRVSEATPTAPEMADARRWAVARWEDPMATAAPSPGLTVVANHDPVAKNARHGKPLHLGAQPFTRGLYCHAPSKIVVRLPGPGAAFSALVGVDSNEQTSGGRGSVEFHVQVGTNTLFRSGVLREGMPPKPVSVDLAGAMEFTLEIDPTPDGIACDQSDWADAKATLKDGREIWLADLPLVELGSASLFALGLPFSFIYGGTPSAEAMRAWDFKTESRDLDAQRLERTLRWTDARSGLEVRCVAIEYRDFPTVEWTLYFKNTGASDTPILERIQALDIGMARGDQGEFLLHHHTGSPADGNDYRPLETTLGPGAAKRLGGTGGRATETDWAYFNLEIPPGGGIVGAIGWPGQWAAEFARNQGKSLSLKAGLELTHFKLLPGEEVRSPLIALQFYQGDAVRAQNVWRRWMMAHSMPKPGGALPRPLLFASSSRQYAEMIQANETNQIAFIKRYLEEGIQLDYWWMDAGWYNHHGGGWPKVGTWEVDTNRFPRGLRPVSDFAHQQKMKTLLWFEPERVSAGTWISTAHPEWMLGRGDGLLNLGLPAARAWLTDHVDDLLTRNGIDLYRQDFNTAPLGLWRKADAPDRQGITEIKHVTGYLAYWDELRRRHPDMLIDSCASGGRRNDLETMRRAVPLWRSDYAFECTGHQCMTYGISSWLPYHGTGTVAARDAGYYGGGATPVEPYAFWSNASPGFGMGIDLRERKLDYATLRRLVAGWREVSPNYYGDFYPLTPWTRDNAVWVAWQFDRPEAGAGMVQVFRRQNSPYETARLPLRGLDANRRYRLKTLEADTTWELPGRELLEKGLAVTLPAKASATTITYTEMPQ